MVKAQIIGGKIYPTYNFLKLYATAKVKSVFFIPQKLE
jgi:hypothetical protein